MMLELVLIPLGILIVLMAKRRRYRRYLKGIIDFELALGTLGGNTTISNVESQVLTESAFLTSVKAVWSLLGMTPTAADGPIMCGVCHSDYTNTEIEEWIEQGASWDQGDMVAQEEARRKIRLVGVFNTTGPGAQGAASVLNDGRPITTKCKWQLTTGDTVKFFAYNQGSGALAAGAVLHVNGHANLWPN